jgi:large repetitive protein
MSSVIITADPISPTIGQPVTFAVSVVTTNGTGPANGTVQFFDGLKPLGTARVSSGTVLLTATLGLGSHTISATYSGDATYPAASQTMGIYVTRLSDSLSLTSNTSTTASGQSITFTARLAWQPVAGVANPSGKVQFFAGCLCGLFGSMINRTLVGTAALSDSVATVTIGNLPDSSPQVAAVYDGDDSWSGTKSNPLTPARK